MNHSHEIVRQILKGRKPKVYYFYHQNATKLIIIDTVKLKAVKNKDNEIVRFELPSWDKDSTLKYQQDRF